MKGEGDQEESPTAIFTPNVVNCPAKNVEVFANQVKYKERVESILLRELYLRAVDVQLIVKRDLKREV